MKQTNHSPVFRVIIMDLLLLIAANGFFVIRVKGYDFGKTKFGERYLLLLIVLNLLWIIINMVVTRYKMDVGKGYGTELKKIIINMLVFTAVISIYAFIFKDLRYSRVIIYGTLSAFAAVITVSHLVILKTFKYWRRKKTSNKKIVIVGTDGTAFDLAAQLSEDKNIYPDIIVYTDGETPGDVESCTVITGKLNDARALFSQHKIDELYIAVASPGEDISELLDTADYHGVRVRMIPAFYNQFKTNFNVHQVGNIPVINVNESPLDYYYNSFYKRVFDLIFSVMVLVLLSPLYLTISLLVKITTRGPVLYIPERVGVDGEVFKMYKFRTMYWPINEKENQSTRQNDPRITPLGKLLRKSNLDELPQFINVLKGQMSVVGPRPHRVHLEKQLQGEVAKYMMRHYVKPGITGWAQVNGWRGPTETEEQKKERTSHDLYYIRNWTFWLDIKIIFLTLWRKDARKNAF